MANIPEFIRRKHNPKLITFPDPRLKDILQQSYGVLTYQDDVLLSAIALAGYTWLEADKFRKAMGKKIPADMKKQRELFVKGCIANGLSAQKAEEFFDLIAPFAGYGFNKAHAACYATIAFRTAYLKAHFPVEFMTALFTAESRGTTGPAKNEKIAQAVAECKRLKLPLLQPDINKSISDFSIEDKTKIRFGLSAIKNVGKAAIESILGARKDKLFTGLADFCSRVNLSTVNKKTMESLIKAGAMDTFGSRASLLIAFPEIVVKASQLKKQESEGQGSLFGDNEGGSSVEFSMVDVDDFTKEEKLGFEKEFLGFYLTSHPHNDILNKIKTIITHELDLLEEEQEGVRVKVGGIIDSTKKVLTKKTNSEMAFMTISNEKGIAVECIVFPKVFERYKALLLNDTVIVIEGRLDNKMDKMIIIVESISPAKNVVG
jgi:DNA polymerase-3 subunit alpha